MNGKDYRIVYTVWHAAGGVDGRDSSVKRSVALVTFNEAEANDRAKEGWYETEVQVEAVDMAAAKRVALSKLTPLDRLALGLDESKPCELITGKYDNKPRW